MIEHTQQSVLDHERIIQTGRAERRVMIEDERAQREKDQAKLNAELEYIRERLDEIAAAQRKR